MRAHVALRKLSPRPASSPVATRQSSWKLGLWHPNSPVLLGVPFQICSQDPRTGTAPRQAVCIYRPSSRGTARWKCTTLSPYCSETRRPLNLGSVTRQKPLTVRATLDSGHTVSVCVSGYSSFEGVSRHMWRRLWK